LLNVLTLAAELGGVSLMLQMVTGISYLIWDPLAGLAAWLVIWKMQFQWMENIFFSSGGREEGWTSKSITEMRVNAFIGFPLGGLLSLAIMAAAVPVLEPASIQVSHLNQVALPVAVAFGRAGPAIVFVSSSRPQPNPPCHPAIRSRSTWAGPGASGTRRARPPGSIWSAWPA
jgi:hypothetical protein